MLLASLLLVSSVVTATHRVFSQVLEHEELKVKPSPWVTAATTCSWSTYVPPTVADRVDPDVKFFTHETGSGPVIFKTGFMIAQAQLLACEILTRDQLKGTAKDTQLGAGFYVYTRVVKTTTPLKIGEGSVGAAMDWMFILKPQLMNRDDMWANSMDGNGNLPMKLGAGAPDLVRKNLARLNKNFHKVVLGFNPERAAGERYDQSPVNSNGGQPAAKMMRTLKGIWARGSDHKHNEQGFLNSIKVKDYVARIIYKGSDFTTQAQVADALKEANQELYDQMGGDSAFLGDNGIIGLAHSGTKIRDLYPVA